MKQILAERGIQLTKSLGQNFLHDANQLRRMVKAAELKKSDKVLEIGPGLGPLTEILIERAGHVLAIEKDERMVRVLSERFNLGQTPALLLLHDDALDFLRREPRDWCDWKIVSNLPYAVASPIVVELAQAQRGPRRMVVTLQLEVAQRLMAEPGEKDYGVLTLLVQLDYEPQEWFKITASCFFPEPEVDSACVNLARRDPSPLIPSEREIYTKIVKRGFSQRRKMMLKLLREDWPMKRLETALDHVEIPSQARAETVSLEQFIRLTQLLSADA